MHVRKFNEGFWDKADKWIGDKMFGKDIEVP